MIFERTCDFGLIFVSENTTLGCFFDTNFRSAGVFCAKKYNSMSVKVFEGFESGERGGWGGAK